MEKRGKYQGIETKVYEPDPINARIEIYITKKGNIKIITDEGEWFPYHKSKDWKET